MFYILILVSILGYSLQGTLIVAFSRTIDPLSLAVYRNVSLIFIMLPVLFFSTTQEYSAIVNQLPWVVLTGISGTTGLAVMFRSVRFLPVGISSGLIQSSGILSSLLLGVVFFGELISAFQLLAVIILLGGVTTLSKARNPMPHLDTHTMRGVILALISGTLIAVSFFLMGKLSRETGPAIAGYFLEASIGVCSLLAVLLRFLVTGRSIEPVPLGTLLKIVLASCPTLLGTGAAAWAVTLGPFGLMRAYSAAGLIVTVFISHIIYREHLSKNQWIGVVITIAAIIGLRLG